MAFGICTGDLEELAPGLYRIDFSKGFSTTRIASGLDKLTFEVLFCLLTTEGTVSGDPECGTLLRVMIGQVAMGPRGSDELSSLITGEVVKVENYLKARQAALGLPPEETLASLVIDEVVVDVDKQSASVRLFITNAADQSVGFEIPELGVAS